MKMTKMQIKMLLGCCVAGSLMLVGCSTDDSIDVGEVDTLLGVGTDGFSIPAGNSDPISLINLFEIDGSDCIDTIQGGNYQFFKKDEGIEETKVKIDPVSIDLDNSKIQTVKFALDVKGLYGSRGSQSAKRRAAQSFHQTISTFNFTENNLTGAIRELKVAEVDKVPFQLRISFSDGLKGLLKHFSGMSLELPEFFGIEENKVQVQNGGVTKDIAVANGVISLTEINTSTDLILNGNIVKIDFTMPEKTSNDGKNYKRKLKFHASPNYKNDQAKVEMNGYIYIDVNYDEDKDLQYTSTTDPAFIAFMSGKTNDDFQIVSTFTIGGNSASPKMNLRDVSGRFFPDIDLSIDPVDITDIPDFLTKDEVNIDLDDIMLELGVKSTLPVVGKVNAKLTPYIKNVAQPSILVKNITIAKEADSKVLISRKDDRSIAGYSDYHWNGDPDGSGDVGKLLSNIPDKIDFECEASADSTNFYTIYLNRNYTIEPSYEIKAPLALKGNSCIVYDDSADGWNEDLKDNDIDLDGETFLMVEGDIINNTPLDLEIDTPTPMGVGETNITVVKVQMLDANDGNINTLSIKSRKTTKLRLKITTTGDGLKELDGIKYAVKAKAASDGTVEPLNGRTHTIQLKDLVATIKGKVTIDLDN